MSRSLLLMMALLMCLTVIIPSSSRSVAATDDRSYTVREIDSWETTVNETSDYGTWTASANALSGATSYVNQSNLYQTHGYVSCRLNVSGTSAFQWAEAVMTYWSNSSQSLFLYDKLTLECRLSESDWMAYMLLRQYNSTTEVDRISSQLTGTAWQTMIISPTWLPNATVFRLDIYLWKFFEYGHVPDWCDLYLDNFRIYSGETQVRVRYWNLYTGLGYYAEKLLCRYYSDGWVDVWQNEFTAYKGDEVLVKVTDIFGRDVWTGIVVVDSDPVYVDILVPIVTVHIAVPDWYNESVPMEWRITCLPWGPDGTRGMTISSIGFEFEVLAGWYSISWLETAMVSAGNVSVYVSGNESMSSSMMLTDLSIPINPDYEVVVEGDDGTIYDIRSWDDFIDVLVALGNDKRFQAVSVLLVGLSIMTYAYQAKKLAKEAQKAQDANRGRPPK